MIATILPSTPTFHAVLYNEKKVAQGSATLLEIKNFGPIDRLGYTDPKELQDYLIEYSARNHRIKNPQFHLAISCKGDEWTHEELLDFGHKYLSEMGYGDPDQPLLIYAHHDTDNNHIHIITSRVDPSGKKISDSNERLRSQKILEKLLGENISKKALADIENAKTFDFRSIRQFKSILEAMNYQVYERKGNSKYLYVKKSGMTQIKIHKNELTRLIAFNEINRPEQDKKERMRLRAILKKYRDGNIDKISLEKELHKVFGYSLVWLGSKDDPFDYSIVDFKDKRVLDGNRILYVRELLDFMSKEERLEQIRRLIESSLDKDPFLSTKELNKLLKATGGYVKKNCFGLGHELIPLCTNIIDILQRNNKLAYRQAFNPYSEDEIRVICKFTGYKLPELLKIVDCSKDDTYKRKETGELFQILFHKNTKEKKRDFHDAGYSFFSDENGKPYIINLKKQVILDVSRIDIPEILYRDILPDKNKKETELSDGNMRQQSGKLPSILKGDSVGHGQNREWEVGKRGIDRDDPDYNRGLGY